MDHHQQSLRLGATVIACALLLRLNASGFFAPVAEFLAQPSISSLLIYLETGRIVRFSPSSDALLVFSPESATPDFAADPTEAALLPAFTAEDAASIEIKYSCSARPDVENLLQQPLDWDLHSGAPTVLILHTHATESYTQARGESYKETSAFRTLDESYNMVSIGDHVAKLLEDGGITVIHDRQLHDYPSYNGSYNHARKSVAEILKKYPTIQLVLDLHRDASGDDYNQMRTEATVDGKTSAQLMLVIGTDASGLKHPQWEENLALGLKLHCQLERIAPGICRYVNLRGQRFNQDLSTGALLIEVGAAGNSHEEALIAAEVLAQGILELSKGTSVS